MIPLEDFKKLCKTTEPEIVVQQCLIESDTFFFNKIKIGQEFNFKRDIASILDVHIRDIVIVGSGKLGFSLKPEKEPPESGLYLFRKFDENEKISDLDIAIISSSLFDAEIKNLYIHTAYQKNSWQERNSLGKYILKGKLPIRFLPNDFPLTKSILEIQQKYRMEYQRDINIEIYKSWYFFETYHQENIIRIHVNLNI